LKVEAVDLKVEAVDLKVEAVDLKLVEAVDWDLNRVEPYY